MAAARCLYCGRWFTPRAGKGGRQKTCGAAACRARHKQALNQQWLEWNPEDRKIRNKKVSDRRREQGYGDAWRALNPDYVERNRAQTRERMRVLRAGRKEAAEVLADPAKYLDGLRGPTEGLFATRELAEGVSQRGKGLRSRMFATQELASRLAVGLWRYMRAQERFATWEGADWQAGGTV